VAARADSIDDTDLLRDGAMETLFSGVRAPSTLGSHLRSYTWSNVRQFGKAHRRLLAALARDPRLLPGREALAFVDIDSTQKRVYGYQKEGAAFGHAKIAGKSLLVRGLEPLIYVAGADEYGTRLRDKLRKEVEEFIASDSDPEERADIHAVRPS
jgi:hypothetical protein